QPQLLVVRDFLAAGYDVLDQMDLAAQFRIAAQGMAEGIQAIEQALGVIEPVDAEDQLPIRKVGAQFPRPLLDRFGGGSVGEPMEIDADREGADADVAGHVNGAAITQAVAHPQPYHRTGAVDGGIEQGPDAVEEIASVALGLEADRVELQQAAEDIEAPGQLEENLQRRERRVQEEAGLDVQAQLAHVRRQRHQVVIVDPDEVAGLGDVGHGLREALVDLAVAAPVAGLEIAVGEEIVEQRPDDFVGEAEVEALHVVFGEHDGLEGAAVVAADLFECGLHLIGVGVGGARPADPDPTAALQYRNQCTDQAAAGGTGFPAAVFALVEY